MIRRVLEEFCTSLIEESPVLIIGNAMPPRDPNEDDDEDEDEDDEEEEEHDDEPAVVREPDED